MDCFINGFNHKLINCQLCKRIKDGHYDKCKTEFEIRQNQKIELRQIRDNCKFHKTAWDEYDQFNACNKNGNGYGRQADDCCPTLDCKQYSK